MLRYSREKVTWREWGYDETIKILMGILSTFIYWNFLLCCVSWIFQRDLRSYKHSSVRGRGERETRIEKGKLFFIFVSTHWSSNDDVDNNSGYCFGIRRFTIQVDNRRKALRESNKDGKYDLRQIDFGNLIFAIKKRLLPTFYKPIWSCTD